MDFRGYEALAFWRASQAAHAAFYENATDTEALDDLDLIATVSIWEPVRERCRKTLARVAPHQQTAASA